MTDCGCFRRLSVTSLLILIAVASCGPYILHLKSAAEPRSLLPRSWISCSYLRMQLSESLGLTSTSLSRTQPYQHQLCTTTTIYVRSVWIVALTIVVYDYLLTLESELKYMWRGPFIRSRLLFWLSRYWSLGYLILGNIVMAVIPASHTK
ncbi:hypothetical protein BKA93DRAFT_192702 [Sparassis latifolia]